MISRRLRSLLVLGVLVPTCAGALASSCTQRQTSDEYQQHLERALVERNRVVDGLDTDELGTEPSYRAAADRVRATRDDLAADAPPRAYERAHELQVDALDGLVLLLGKLGRCAGLERAAAQDARACRDAIPQDVFDDVRNDFTESDAIYRAEGLSLAGLGGEGSGDDGGSGGGDVLDEPSGGDRP